MRGSPRRPRIWSRAPGTWPDSPATGGLGQLRLLRVTLAVLLRAAAAPGVHPGRGAGPVGAGRSQARRARGVFPSRQPMTHRAALTDLWAVPPSRACQQPPRRKIHHPVVRAVAVRRTSHAALPAIREHVVDSQRGGTRGEFVLAVAPTPLLEGGQSACAESPGGWLGRAWVRRGNGSHSPSARRTRQRSRKAHGAFPASS